MQWKTLIKKIKYGCFGSSMPLKLIREPRIKINDHAAPLRLGMCLISAMFCSSTNDQYTLLRSDLFGESETV